MDERGAEYIKHAQTGMFNVFEGRCKVGEASYSVGGVGLGARGWMGEVFEGGHTLTYQKECPTLVVTVVW